MTALKSNHMPPNNQQPAAPQYPNETPPASPPPQMPTTPYQSTVSAPIYPDQSELSEQYKKPRRRWIVPLAAIILLAAICAGGWFGYQAYTNNPATLFNQALGKSLSTKQVTQNVSSSTSAAVVTLDVSDVKKPHVSSLTTNNFGVSTYVKGYGTLQNTYLSYANNPNSATNTPINLIDQWIRVRSNGTLPTGAALTPLLTTIDPRYEMLSPWVFGNFTKKDRGTITGLARSSKLYQINSKTVKEEKLNGHQVKIYEVGVNHAALADYFTKVGQTFGIPSTDSGAAAKLYGTRIQLKVYIQKDTQQIVRLDTTSDGVTTTTLYDYHSVKFPDEPNPDFTYDDFLSRIGQ